MARPGVWRDNQRIPLQAGVLATGCGLAAWVDKVVAADTLSDVQSVALQIGVLLAFTGAAAMGARTAWRARAGSGIGVLCVMPLGFALAGAVFASVSYVPVSIALHELTAPADVASDTALVLGPGGRDVRLSGDLTEGLADTLAAFLDAHPAVTRIHLTSDGGLSDEGEALGALIAAHGLTTFVPDHCVSACTLAFLGGRERLLMTGAHLGFHAPYEEGLLGQTFASDKSFERAAYIADGVAPDFVDKALDVAPADIWTPEPERLVAAHVATGVVGRYRFPDSNLDGAATLRGARDMVLRNFAAARALEPKRPHDVDVIAAWYFEAYRNGMSEGQAVDEIKARLALAAHAPPTVLSVVDGPH